MASPSPLQAIHDARQTLECSVAEAVSEFIRATGGVEITEIEIELLTHRESLSPAVMQVLGSVKVQVKV